MSTKIDEQVVAMRFDNSNFEKNVSNTMSTLDKLKEKLNFKGMSKGLEDVEKSAKKVDLSPMSKSAEQVGLKFNAMYAMADQAMRNITNSAMMYGKKIVSAFTIDPIKTGFQEYETQINSVQTILANTESKGSTLQDVNNALAELNTYADKTIYNFTEMTRNIGTFTAAGVDLKTSVAAIKGIANLAAVSGSTSQQASTAMYQLSQALSSGTVKLMDWNSVVNAGMGGQVFQDSLKETARVHGIAIDDMIEKNGSFRETLQEGWLTSEILTETLSKFTGDLSEAQLKSMGYTDEQIKKIVKMGNTANDAATKVKTFTQLFDTLKEAAQSGWTKSWELLIGDFGEAKELLTDISNLLGGIIGASGDKRNAMLMGGLSTGWKQLLNEGINDAAGFEEMVAKVSKEHGVDIASMIDDEHSFQDVLKKSLKEGTLNSDVLGESISKFTDKVSNMSAKELEAAGYTAEHVKKLKELDEGVKNGSISMEKFTELIIRPSGRELLIESLWNSIKALESVLKPVKEAFSEFFPAIEGEQLYKLIEKLRDFTANLTLSGDQAENLKRTFRGVFAVLDIGVQIIKAIAGGFVDLVRYIAPAGNGLLAFTGDIGDFLVKLNTAAKSSDVFNKAIAGIGKILKPIADGVKEFAKVIGESFADISKQSEKRFGPLSAMGNAIKSVFVGLGKVLGKLAPWVSKLAMATGKVFGDMMDKITSSIQNADYSSFYDLLNGGIFSAIGVFIARFMKGASDITAGAGDFMDNINGILEGVGDAINAFTGSIKANTLKTIATGIAILAASLLVLSLIDSEKLTGSLAAITVLFGELMASMSIFGKISDGKSFKNINKITRAMISLSTALLVLAVAMKIMSTMSYDEMAVGIISTIAGLGFLVLAVNALPPENVTKAAKAIKKLSTSLVIFAVAMKIMSTMSWTEMKIGLATTVVGLGALVAAVKLLPKDASRRVAGMVGLATALVILAGALKIMASMSYDEMAVGIISTIAGLGFLVLAVNALPKNTMVKVAGMVGLATALVILAGALKIMASMSWEEIDRCLVTLSRSLLYIIAALLLMKGTISGAAALLIAAASLAVLAPVLKTLGSMSWEEIVKGLVALAGAFTVIGIAGLLLTPLIPSILGLAGAIALLGIGCAAIGAGVVLVATGITALSVALAAGGGAIVVFISSLVGLIPYIIQQIGIGIISLCDVISGSADSICKAFTVIVLALVDAIVASVPALVDGALILIESLLQSLVEHAPKIVGGLYDFIIAMINALAEKLPDLIQAGVNLLMSLFVGVIDSLKTIDTEVLLKGIIGIGLITALLLALSFVASLVPGAMLGVLGVAAVVAEIALLLAAIGALAQIPGLEWLISEGGDFLQKVGTAIGQFIGGIIGGIAEGVSSALPQIGSDLSSFMTNVSPFIDGVKMVDKQVLDGVGILAEAILALTAADLLNAITSFITGGNSFDALSENLKSLGDGLNSFADSIKDWTPEMSDKVDIAGTVLSTLGNKNLKNLKTVGKHLKTFGEKFKAFVSKVSEVDGDSVTKACNSVTKIIDTVKNLDSTVADSVSAFTDSLKKLAEDGVNKFIKVFATANVDATETINTFITKTANDVKTDTNKDKFKSVGKYLMEGFAAGITNNQSLVTTAMEKACKAALTTAQTTLKIQSPSVVFKKEVGRWIVEGIAEGIDKNTSAEEAIEKKASNLVSAFRDKLDELNRVTEKNDLDYQLWEAKNSGLGDAVKSAKQLETLTKNLTTVTEKTKVAHDKYTNAVGEFGENSKYAKEAWNEYLQAAIDEQNLINEIAEAKKNSVESLKELTRENEDLQYELWVKKHPEASLSAKHAMELQNLDSDRTKLAIDEANAWKEYNKLLKDPAYGAKHADTIAAHSKWLTVLIEQADVNARIAEIQKESVDDRVQSARELRDATKEAADIEYETWVLSNPKATDAEKDAAEIKRLTAYRIEVGKESLALLKEYKKIQKDKNATQADILEAKNAYESSLNDEKSIDRQIADIQEAALEREANNLENQRKLMSDIAQLKYDIWEETYGRDAKDEEKDAKKLEMLNEQAIIQAQLLATAQQAYNKVLKETGDASSNEALQAQSDVLNAQLALARLKGQILDIEEDAADRQKKLQDKQRIAQSDYKEYIKKYKKYYLENGMTIEDLERDAKLISGYDPTAVINKAISKNSPEQTINKTLSEASKTLKNIESNTTYKEVVENLGEMGGSYVTAISEGMTTNMSIITNTVTSIVDNCIKTMEKRYSSWKDAGVYLVNGFVRGINSRVTAAANAAASMAYAASKAAEQALRINSPSKVFERIGMYVDMGLAQGIRKYTGLAETETTEMSNSVIDRFRSTVSQIADAINSDIDTQPTIRPVLDLSNIKSGTARINAMFSRSQALSASAGIEANRHEQNQNGNNETVNPGNTFTFTQNNYSPKALSPTEIYRQTRNQFTAMKEALNK